MSYAKLFYSKEKYRMIYIYILSIEICFRIVLIVVAYYKHYFLFNNFKIGFSKSKLCKEKLIDVDENS